VQLYAIKSKLILPGDSLAARFVEALSAARLRVKNGDIIAITSKVVSLSERNIVSLASVKPTVLARRLGRRFDMLPEFAQVVLNESDAIYGGVPGVLLTLKNGDAISNSGVDRKNAPGDSVIPWPVNPQRSAETIQRTVNRKLARRIGVVIVDSRVTPLRQGTIGLAIACSGFQPVRDSRGIKDLYGRKAQITLQALADGIAAAAQLLMGETRETIPFVLVRGAPVQLGSRKGSDSMTLPVKDCLYMSQMPRPRFFPRRNRPFSTLISNLGWAPHTSLRIVRESLKTSPLFATLPKPGLYPESRDSPRIGARQKIPSSKRGGTFQASRDAQERKPQLTLPKLTT